MSLLDDWRAAHPDAIADWSEVPEVPHYEYIEPYPALIEKTYTKQQGEFIKQVVSERQPLPEPPLPLSAYPDYSSVKPCPPAADFAKAWAEAEEATKVHTLPSPEPSRWELSTYISEMPLATFATCLICLLIGGLAGVFITAVTFFVFAI